MPGGIFISYRREDSAGIAGRIYDRLAGRYGREKVFFDVNSIAHGDDYVRVLSDRVGDCDALIVIIGRDWLKISDEHHRRRLDDPHDYVRVEIETALERVKVFPVIVDGAIMPTPEALPDGLKALARRQKVDISHDRFDADAERLTNALIFVERENRPSAVQAPVESPNPGPIRRDAINAVAIKPPKPGRILDPDDLQKGRWGGRAGREGRKLVAVLDQVRKSYFFVNLVVSATDGSPLVGPVIFHLHDSFAISVIHIRRIREQSWAMLEEVSTEGVFTVGVQVKDRNNRWTSLELDLATLPGLPKRFRTLCVTG
jgi:hypothetical protein